MVWLYPHLYVILYRYHTILLCIKLSFLPDTFIAQYFQKVYFWPNQFIYFFPPPFSFFFFHPPPSFTFFLSPSFTPSPSSFFLSTEHIYSAPQWTRPFQLQETHVHYPITCAGWLSTHLKGSGLPRSETRDCINFKKFSNLIFVLFPLPGWIAFQRRKCCLAFSVLWTKFCICRYEFYRCYLEFWIQSLCACIRNLIKGRAVYGTGFWEWRGLMVLKPCTFHFSPADATFLVNIEQRWALYQAQQ